MKNNAILFPIVLLLSASVIVGCDYLDSRAIDRERADSVYRDAMADYAAGHIDKAISGLERVIAATPANSSARFQLACLLQDSKKDYLGAICHYREFLLLDKSGDKSGLAKDRLEQCERLLGPELVKKYDLGGNASLTEANASLTAKVAELEKTNAELKKNLDQATVRAQESEKATERMRKMLKGEPSEDAKKPVISTEMALLDDESDGSADRIKFSKDVKNLVLESEKEDSATPFEVVAKKPEPERKKPVDPYAENRPAEYVVQEGDTLYKIAVRFYGKRSAWTQIREANKTVISTDGRIKVGQKLVLP